MDEISHIVPIAHVLPITLCSDGEIRVLLGEKRVGERIDEILLQPFGGKKEKDELLAHAGPRELLEEVDGFDEKIATEFFNGEDLSLQSGFYGVFSAPSDVKKDKILTIHCWGKRLLSQIPVSEKPSSEMKNPRWYTFKEIFDHPKSGTLTKVMAACYGGMIYYDNDCIEFLQQHINHSYLPLRITILQTLLAIARNQENRTKYTVEVLQNDVGLLSLIARIFPDLKGETPKRVIFECGKLVGYEL